MQCLRPISAIVLRGVWRFSTFGGPPSPINLRKINIKMFKDVIKMIHLPIKTYFPKISVATSLQVSKPSLFDRGGPNAVPEAYFRDSSSGAPEIFNFWWHDFPYTFKEDVIMMSKRC
jgi:hypothetical protein